VEEVLPLPDDDLELGNLSSLSGAPVFLIGCARSGTSILGEAIAAHPRVAYLFEASAIWNTLVPEQPDHRLTGAQASAPVARAIDAALAKERRDLPGDVLVEKNPKHVIRIPFLEAIYPDARFLHIIRDGRDTVASLMFRNRGEHWGHLEIPGWRELLKRYPTENHVRCAHQWRDAVTVAQADGRSLPPSRYHEVRYETLLRDATGVVGKVLEFLDLPPHPEVDRFLPRIQDATEGSYHAKKQVRHYIDNHSRRIGRYRENLTPPQVNEVEAVCGDLLRRLGY
jgi:hypothetical protein